MEKSTITKMQLVQNQSYRATLKLGMVESFVSNNTVAKKLMSVGFTNVMVTGSGKDRTATGVWSGKTQDADVPEEVVKIEKV